MGKVRIAIAGAGNCASSLIQGIEYYRRKPKDDSSGLMHWNLGGHHPHDIEVVCTFDIDARKAGKDLSETIFQPPNCTPPSFTGRSRRRASPSAWGGSWTVSPPTETIRSRMHSGSLKRERGVQTARGECSPKLGRRNPPELSSHRLREGYEVLRRLRPRGQRRPHQQHPCLHRQ